MKGLIKVTIEWAEPTSKTTVIPRAISGDITIDDLTDIVGRLIGASLMNSMSSADYDELNDEPYVTVINNGEQ